MPVPAVPANAGRAGPVPDASAEAFFVPRPLAPGITGKSDKQPGKSTQTPTGQPLVG